MNQLLSWGLGTFHATALLLALLVAQSRAGTLGGFLGSLGTAPGLVLFVGLWLATWWSTRRALLATRGTESWTTPLGDLCWNGFLWGGVNGMLFLVIFFGVRLAPQFTTEGLAAAGTFFLGLVLIGTASLAVAALLGATVGLAFALVDCAALALARWLVPFHPPSPEVVYRQVEDSAQPQRRLMLPRVIVMAAVTLLVLAFGVGLLTRSGAQSGSVSNSVTVRATVVGLPPVVVLSPPPSSTSPPGADQGTEQPIPEDASRAQRPDFGPSSSNP